MPALEMFHYSENTYNTFRTLPPFFLLMMHVILTVADMSQTFLNSASELREHWSSHDQNKQNSNFSLDFSKADSSSAKDFKNDKKSSQ